MSGVTSLIDRFLPVPEVGLGPSLNLLPRGRSAKPATSQPTLNLATPQPTLNLEEAWPSADRLGTQARAFAFVPSESQKRAGRTSPAPQSAPGFRVAGPARSARRTRGLALRVPRLVLTACLWTVLGAGVGVLLSVSVPLLFGYRTFIVMSGSMEPTIHTGDVVVDKQIAPDEAQVGDVVTYRDPEHHSRLITHRVRGVRVSGDKVSFVTRGDANSTSQKWTITTNGSVGVVKLRVVKLGYLLYYINQPIGRFLLMVVPVLLLAMNEIVLIWRKDPKRKEHRVVVWA